jgi:phage host-nuclease inhibitor protein Gam
VARPRKASVELQSIEECTTAMGDLAVTQQRLKRLLADRDLEISTLTAAAEPAIDIERKWAMELETRLCVYYHLHLSELEKDGKRSVQLATGVMGRRLGPPKLTPLNRNWTWDAVRAKVQALFGVQYLRQADPELDKDALKKDLVPEQLHECGMKLAQDEKFYVEPAALPGLEVAN